MGQQGLDESQLDDPNQHPSVGVLQDDSVRAENLSWGHRRDLLSSRSSVPSQVSLKNAHKTHTNISRNIIDYRLTEIERYFKDFYRLRWATWSRGRKAAEEPKAWRACVEECAVLAEVASYRPRSASSTSSTHSSSRANRSWDSSSTRTRLIFVLSVSCTFGILRILAICTIGMRTISTTKRFAYLPYITRSRVVYSLSISRYSSFVITVFISSYLVLVEELISLSEVSWSIFLSIRNLSHLLPLNAMCQFTDFIRMLVHTELIYDIIHKKWSLKCYLSYFYFN